MLPGTVVLAEVDEPDEPDGLAEGLAPLDSRATTLVSVPFRVVTVMPAAGSASLLPLAGGRDPRGVGVAVFLLAALLPLLLWPLPAEQAARSRDSAATTMPAARLSHGRALRERVVLVLRRTVLLLHCLTGAVRRAGRKAGTPVSDPPRRAQATFVNNPNWGLRRYPEVAVGTGRLRPAGPAR